MATSMHTGSKRSAQAWKNAWVRRGPPAWPASRTWGGPRRLALLGAVCGVVLSTGCAQVPAAGPQSGPVSIWYAPDLPRWMPSSIVPESQRSAQLSLPDPMEPLPSTGRA